MKFAIGTVQFGTTYGISNKIGQTSTSEVKKILEIAAKNNIKILDTAAAYGESEKVLGICINKNHNFDIVTKIPTFKAKEVTQNEILKLNKYINNSLKKTKQKSFYGILFHDANDIFTKNGQLLLKELNKLKNDKVISKVGFSTYNSNQINSLMNFCEFDLIQLPINIFDQRLLQDGTLKKLKLSNIEIHARSIFLQGLLLMQPETIPPFFYPIHREINLYHLTIKEKNISPIQAALNFVKKIKEIDYMVIGINNSKQLMENIQAYKSCNKNLTYEQLAINDEKFINPMNWKI